MDDLDLHRQRRNLIAVSIALFAFEAAGGTLGKVELLNGGVTLTDPHWVLRLVYLMWAYLIWRYWLYSKGQWRLVHEAFLGKLHHSRTYKALISPHVKAFREASGVEYAESWEQFIPDDTPGEKPTPIPLSNNVRRGFVSTTLVLEIGKAHNPKGEFHPDRAEYPLPFWRYELNLLGAAVRAAAADKTFSDLVVPYLVATSVIVAKIVNVLNG